MNILMQMASGVYADFERIHELELRLDDIAHHLAMRVRFGGACNEFYSVAQHAVRVSRLVATRQPSAAFCGLHHDDTEYLIGDMVKPLKVKDDFFADFEDSFSRVQLAPFLKLDPEMPRIVKWADTVLLIAEMEQFLPNGIAGYDFPLDMITEARALGKCTAWTWRTAKHAFLREHELLRSSFRG